MKNKDFCIFIISHGRANNVVTWRTLDKKKSKYPRYIVIDDLDEQIDEYKKKYGDDKIIVFNKEKIAKTTDHGDNFYNLRTTTHARNACYYIAKDLGYSYFLVLDDDYTGFQYRIDGKFNYPNPVKSITKLDKIFDMFLDYYKSIPAKSICMAQGGDYIGGNNGFGIGRTNYSRKAMNSWFCSIDRPIKFLSRLNEDVNTYLTLGSRGELFLTIPFVSLSQTATQKVKGGMTDSYLHSGTYVKSFYTVMYCPSFCKVSLMRTTNMRLHHKINWNNAVPKIISPINKKQ
jgi:hypothetical protein